MADLIDIESISSVIDEAGSNVKIFFPNITVDMAGNTASNYLTDAVLERALIRPKTETNIINEQGLQQEGDSLGYFKSNSKIRPECEVHMTRPDLEPDRSEVVYFVISVQPSYFEGELKFIKAICQLRRY